MTPLQRYIAEEIATDHVDGLLSRREALRRMALIGVGAAAAGALITACGQDREQSAGSSSPASSPTPTPATSADRNAPGADTQLATEPVTWAGPAGELRGAWAAAPTPKGALLVIHENKGLTEWAKSIAGRLAGIGYSALAIDLLSGQGGTDAFTDPAQATAALSKITPEQFVADLRSGIGEVARRTPGVKLAAIGFCMGGGLVWQLLAAGEPQLAAAFPFYGPLPEGANLGGSRDVAVLGFYGEKDARVNATQQAAELALTQAGMVHELVVEQGADHAFFNDTGERYDPTAAADAWQRVQAWLTSHVG